jgi:hypothetical protein
MLCNAINIKLQSRHDPPTAVEPTGLLPQGLCWQPSLLLTVLLTLVRPTHQQPRMCRALLLRTPAVSVLLQCCCQWHAQHNIPSAAVCKLRILEGCCGCGPCCCCTRPAIPLSG